MICVAGATGWLGGSVVRLLRKQGHTVRALVRSTSDRAKVAALEAVDAHTVVGDFKDAPSLAAAVEGVDTVITTVSATLARQPGDSLETVDQLGTQSLIDAAKTAGVKQFIYVSFPSSPVAPFPLQDVKRAAEQKLKASGMGFTILQPTYFMDIWLSPALGFDFEKRTATLYGDEGKLWWVSVDDVARATAAAVGRSQAMNTVVPFGGPEPLSYPQVVKIFEEESKATFTTQLVPAAALAQQLAAAPTAMDKSFAALMLTAAKGSAIDPSVAEHALGYQPTDSVRAYAKRVAGAR